MAAPKRDPLMEGLYQRRANWQSIATSSHRQHSCDDILGYACLEALEWTDPIFDPENGEHWDLLGAIVRNKYVNYAEKNIAYAVQMDHAPRYSDDIEGQHPLLNQLRSDSQYEPLQQLLDLEESKVNPYLEHIKALGYSKLAGFLMLLFELDTTRKHAAQHLLMSHSWLYCCIVRAQKFEQNQILLFQEEPLISVDQLHTWRPFQIKRAKVLRIQQPLHNQVAFAF